jgi:ABC-2 type transport system permease protein
VSNGFFRKIWLVAARELRQRGRSRAYRVTTALLLVAVAAGVVIPALLANHNNTAQKVGIVGPDTAGMTSIVQEAGKITGTSVTVVTEPSQAAAEAALKTGTLSAVLVQDSQVLIKQVPLGGSGGTLPSAIASVAGLSRLLTGVPASRISGGAALPVTGLLPAGASLSRRLTGLFAAILLWVMINTYGQQIATGVVEEKSNRIVEVILSAIRPIQLLTGKVLGIGLLALGQAVSMLAVFLGLGFAVGSSVVHGAAAGIVGVGAVFFLLGYAFYCTAYAAAGSLVTRQAEVSTALVPVGIPLMVTYILSYTVLYATNANAFFRVLGFLPPTSPIAMPVLYAAGDVPLWQVAVSAGLLALGTVWMARVAAGIYARSVLRTGARIRLRQALREGR